MTTSSSETDSTEFRVSLMIRDPKEGERPGLTLEIQSEVEPILLAVDAVGFDMDEKGALAVASLLRETANAIDAELGIAVELSAEEATRQYNAAQERLRTRQKNPNPCTRPPEGWYCSRAEGHEGPCPTRQLVRELGAKVSATERARLDIQAQAQYDATLTKRPRRFNPQPRQH